MGSDFAYDFKIMRKLRMHNHSTFQHFQTSVAQTPIITKTQNWDGVENNILEPHLQDHPSLYVLLQLLCFHSKTFRSATLQTGKISCCPLTCIVCGACMLWSTLPEATRMAPVLLLFHKMCKTKWYMKTYL